MTNRQSEETGEAQNREEQQRREPGLQLHWEMGQLHGTLPGCHLETPGSPWATAECGRVPRSLTLPDTLKTEHLGRVPR